MHETVNLAPSGSGGSNPSRPTRTITETLNFDYTLSAHNVVESLHFRLKIKTGFAGTLKINKAVGQWGIYTIASYKGKPMKESEKACKYPGCLYYDEEAKYYCWALCSFLHSDMKQLKAEEKEK